MTKDLEWQLTALAACSVLPTAAAAAAAAHSIKGQQQSPHQRALPRSKTLACQTSETSHAGGLLSPGAAPRGLTRLGFTEHPSSDGLSKTRGLCWLQSSSHPQWEFSDTVFCLPLSHDSTSLPQVLDYLPWTSSQRLYIAE